ncbi:MAG: PrgI family protein [Ruminococcus sp.]|mgnify:CR=1 FL=1|nr:PrgI family protein [Ruminococcus sp.]
MAQHIKIPKDLDDIREKFMFGLTKRQCLCFAIGFLVGVPVFFLTRKYGMELGIIAMGFAAAPAIVCGIYKKNGLTFEKYLKAMIKFMKKPKTRTYKSENIYEKIEKQIEIDRCKIRLSGGLIYEYKREE